MKVRLEDYVKKPRIAMAFGIEIECGIEKIPEAMPRGWECGNDGSIGIDSAHRWLIPKEIRTIGARYKVCDIPKFREDLEKIMRMVGVSYANETCGIHIHISFRNKYYYQLICSHNFYNYFMTKYNNKFTDPVSQARRSNSHCHIYRSKDEFISYVDKQIVAYEKGECRYRTINYCYNLKGTAEFRIFKGTVDTEKIIDMVEFLLDTIAEYIHNFKDNPIIYELDGGDL